MESKGSAGRSSFLSGSSLQNRHRRVAWRDRNYKNEIFAILSALGTAARRASPGLHGRQPTAVVAAVM